MKYYKLARKCSFLFYLIIGWFSFSLKNHVCLIIVRPFSSLAAKNGVVYEIWENIGGNDLAKLKTDPRFPNNPDRMEVLPNFQSAQGVGDNYAARLSTYYRVII